MLQKYSDSGRRSFCPPRHPQTPWKRTFLDILWAFTGTKCPFVVWSICPVLKMEGAPARTSSLITQTKSSVGRARAGPAGARAQPRGRVNPIKSAWDSPVRVPAQDRSGPAAAPLLFIARRRRHVIPTQREAAAKPGNTSGCSLQNKARCADGDC